MAYPLSYDPIYYGATGEGVYFTSQAYECSGRWEGSWNDMANDFELIDPPTAPGEMSRWVRIGVDQAPISLYVGDGCSTGADPFPMYYGAMSSPPMIDLLATGTQTYVVTSNTLCSAPGTEVFTGCEATATWTVRVDPLAAPPQ